MNEAMQEARVTMGLTQADLSKLTGLTQIGLSTIERRNCPRKNNRDAD